MNNRLRARTWAYVLIAGIAISLSIVLAAYAVFRPSRVGTADASTFLTASPKPQARTVDTPTCARVLLPRVPSSPRATRRIPRSTSEAHKATERACLRALADNFEPGFFVNREPYITTSQGRSK